MPSLIWPPLFLRPCLAMVGIGSGSESSRPTAEPQGIPELNCTRMCVRVPGVCRGLLSASRPGKGARPAPTSTGPVLTLALPLPYGPVYGDTDSSPSPEAACAVRGLHTCKAASATSAPPQAPRWSPWGRKLVPPRRWPLVWAGGAPGSVGEQKRSCAQNREADAWTWTLAWGRGRGAVGWIHPGHACKCRACV